MLRLQYVRRVGNQKISVAGYQLVVVLAGVLLVLPLANRVSGWQSPAGTGAGNAGHKTVEQAHPAPSTQTIYAPIGLGNPYVAELVLNNNSPGNMDVTPAFYTTEGTTLTGRRVTLEPSEVRNMAVADLMPPDPHTVDVAGMTLTYFGGMLEVGAQITLLGQGGTSSVDIPFSAGMDYQIGR